MNNQENLGEEFELTDMDAKHIQQYTYSKKDNAMRVKIINPSASSGCQCSPAPAQPQEVRIIEIEKPMVVIQKEIEIREIEKPVVHVQIQREVQIVEIEKIVMVDRPEVQVIQTTKEVPVIVERSMPMDVWIKVALVGQCLMGIYLILSKFI